MLTVNSDPSLYELRRFYLSVPAVLAALGCILIFWKPHLAGIWRQLLGGTLCVLAAGLLAIYWLAPSLSRWCCVRWMTLSAAIGVVVSTAILTVLYFTLLAPFALLRLRDPLRVRPRAGASAWSDCNYTATLDRMRRRF